MLRIDRNQEAEIGYDAFADNGMKNDEGLN